MPTSTQYKISKKLYEALKPISTPSHVNRVLSDSVFKDIEQHFQRNEEVLQNNVAKMKDWLTWAVENFNRQLQKSALPAMSGVAVWESLKVGVGFLPAPANTLVSFGITIYEQSSDASSTRSDLDDSKDLQGLVMAWHNRMSDLLDRTHHEYIAAVEWTESSNWGCNWHSGTLRKEHYTTCVQVYPYINELPRASDDVVKGIEQGLWQWYVKRTCKLGCQKYPSGPAYTGAGKIEYYVLGGLSPDLQSYLKQRFGIREADLGATLLRWGAEVTVYETAGSVR